MERLVRDARILAIRRRRHRGDAGWRWQALRAGAVAVRCRRRWLARAPAGAARLDLFLLRIPRLRRRTPRWTPTPSRSTSPSRRRRLIGAREGPQCFNETMIAELRAHLRALGADPGVRAMCWPPAGRRLRRADLDWMTPHGGLLARREPARRPATGRHAAHDLRVPEADHRPVHGDAYAAAWDWWPPATWPSRHRRRLLPERDPLGLIPATIQPLRDPRHSAPTQRGATC